MSQPIAYLLTWTIYGTWLHGDQRGSVDDTHNQFGTPYLDPDHSSVVRESDAMLSPAVWLDHEMRGVVRDELIEH